MASRTYLRGTPKSKTTVERGTKRARLMDTNLIQTLPTSTRNINATAAIEQLNSLTCAVNELTKTVTESSSIVQQLACDIRSINKTVQDHELKLKVLEKSVNNSGSDLSSVKSDTILLKREINKSNLILFGVDESSDESNFVLMEAVKRILAQLSDQLIQIDTVFRIGKITPRNTRPIKIRFVLISHRNTIFANRGNLPDTLKIKEDLPFEIRRDHAILFQKKQQAIKDGIHENNIFINYKTNSIDIRQMQPQRNPEPQPSSSTFLGNSNRL